MTAILEITDVELANPEDVCTCRHPLGHTIQDHPTVIRLQHISRRCSVCGQVWGLGAVSQHEHCAWLGSDGSRQYADCQVFARLDGAEVEIQRHD